MLHFANSLSVCQFQNALNWIKIKQGNNLRSVTPVEYFILQAVMALMREFQERYRTCL